MDKHGEPLPKHAWDINDPELNVAASLGYYYDVLKKRELRLRGKHQFTLSYYVVKEKELQKEEKPKET